MRVYYIKTEGEGGILHDVVFTTEALAIAYLAHDAGLTYHSIYGWQDAEGKTVAQICVARLHVD